MRHKSARKRASGIQESATSMAVTPEQRPLKSLLRVRLPPSAKHGTIMSVYQPDASPSATPSASPRKRVLFVTEPPTESVSSVPVSTESQMSSGVSRKHKRRVNQKIDGCRSSKARRLSDAAATKIIAQRHSEDGIEDKCTPLTPLTACLTPPVSLVSNQPSPPDWMQLGRNYRGFCHFGHTVSPPVPEICYSSLTAKEFFEQFVIPRRPCVLKLDKTGTTDLEPLITQWTSNDYLRKKAGKCLINVEVRDKDKGELFGEGRKTEMEFADFLDALEKGDESYYATTQKIKEDDEGPLYLGGDLLWKTPLTNDFPNTPSIMGNLVPYQHNLWMGHSTEESSSGLHHDYHDSFYITIRGTKTFRLYSPRCAEALKTVGQIVKIHENGLICYNDLHRSDGADEASVLQWRAKQADAEVGVLKRRLEATEKHVKDLSGLIRRVTKRKQIDRPFMVKDLPTKKWIAIAKQFVLTPEISIENLQTELNSKIESKKLLEGYIEGAMEKCKRFLKMKRNIERKPSNQSQTTMIDDDDNDDEADFSSDPDEAEGILDDHQMEQNKSNRSSLELLEGMMDDTMKKELEATRKTWQLECRRRNDGNESQGITDRKCNGGLKAVKQETMTLESPVDTKPANFCRQNTQSRGALNGTLNLFPEAVAQNPDECLEDQLLQSYLEVTLGPADCLYLPASWFHEVISTSSISSSVTSTSDNSQPSACIGHLAFNYWFYPPAVPSATFAAPYIDEYWGSRYRRTLERMQFENRILLLRSFGMNQGSGEWMRILQLLQAGLPPEVLGLETSIDDDSSAIESEENEEYEEDDWVAAMMADEEDDTDGFEDRNLVLFLPSSNSPPKKKSKAKKNPRTTLAPSKRKNPVPETCDVSLESGGIHSGSDGIHSGSDGIHSGSDGIHSGSDGIHSGSDGIHSGSDGIHSGSDGIHSGSDGIHSGSDGIHSGSDGIHSGSDGANSESVLVSPRTAVKIAYDKHQKLRDRASGSTKAPPMYF